MKMTRGEFDQKLQDQQLVLTLIGMSGMGKSYRARQLAKLGFHHMCCDDLIAGQISHILSSVDVTGLAAWMGQPYTNGYSEREATYLNLEDGVTRKALEESSGKIVIDTTGSVIYLSEGTLKKIKESTLVVFLEANQAKQDELFQLYLTDPKPVAWGKGFNRRDGESDRDALVRCYPKLLEFRARRYESLADVRLPYGIARNHTSSAEEFLLEICSRLE